ncbi:DNA repair helicase [Alicyclobacillus hesperidum]|uniref:DNA repair helicase n=1 Tax=Alicyclobacillus hesperidum TaxID=89784 RepID=A0A1H2TW10_9BACL|nr:DUF3427 domain-containing protein [Alicyclobacillus hesperidum]GLV14031.1 DNA repair helicase [Alicyclobacillus hesperidum]SDW47898.1 Helicase conserved C-terminal domain-containing protein [Alicyclobacillus hesperidum]
MNRPRGIYEELQQANKQYPQLNQRSTVVPPNLYAQFLTQQITRDIGLKLQKLANEQRYDEMMKLTQGIESIINENQDSSFHKPLSTITYRYDDEYIPIYPDMYLAHPAFISNHATGTYAPNFFKFLKYELQTADQIYFMVSFIRWSGIQLLLRTIDERLRQGKPMNILTTDYMYITEPKALRRLLDYENVQIRLYHVSQESFHTKAYMFARESGLHSVIIGSSNLSHAALKTGHEWNLKLPHTPHFPVFTHVSKQFDEIWNMPQSTPVDIDVLQEYEHMYNQYNRVSSRSVQQVAEQKVSYEGKKTLLQPNKMQCEALRALAQTRQNGFRKGVVIAATGTGKTYLAAFDVKQQGAKSVLFLAHREELLENATETFIDVIGDPTVCGKLTGNEKVWDKPYLFSTVQTMHRDDVLSRFHPNHFDYIIVDEFHHAQAETYRKIIYYFQPKFLLGLTATPERMDGRDVLELCENNVVYEIRLRDALSNDLLVPFHYFGLADRTVDYDKIATQNGQFDVAQLARALATHERADYIIEMMEKYGHDGNKRVALGFCANIEHAEFMAQEFRQRGYEAAVLTGNDSIEVRKQTLQRLQNVHDPLEIIFTVDIFNEGIDIPNVNLLLFLRPTESSTIFLQQLGRGLRKAIGKQYVTVLDFIGNYQKSFVVPLALSGQFHHKAFDRDSLRIAVETEFADLPDGCFVDLEPITREHILKKIESVRMDRTEMLKDLYRSFRQLLGRAPEIQDFLYSDDAPAIHFFISKFGSWVETKKKMGDTNEFDEAVLRNTFALEVVRTLEKMLPVKWPYDFAILESSLTSGNTTMSSVITHIQGFFGVDLDEENCASYIARSMRKLSTTQDKKTWSFGTMRDESFILNSRFLELCNMNRMREYLNKRLHYGLVEFRRTYRPSVFFNQQQGVILYQNYTRNDLIYLFGADAKEGSWREGVSRVRNHYLLFVNLNKDVSVAEHLQYHDFFMDNHHFHWQSQNATAHHSDRGQDYILHKERGIHIHLFVRKFEKMHGDTLPFMYLGEVDYVSSHGDQPMNITWRLQQPVPDEIYFDFIR